MTNTHMEGADALVEAITAGDAARVRALLEASPACAAGCDANGVSVLLLALYHRQGEIATLIANRRDTLDAFEAAALGNTAALASALDATPAELTERAPDGFTALHLACFFAHVDTARLLLERGADANAVAGNPSLLRPIHSAAAARAHEIVTMLLDRGADPNIAQHGGWTPLHAAAKYGDDTIVRTLLARGATAGLTSEDGKTALDLAAEAGHLEVVKVLEG